MRTCRTRISENQQDESVSHNEKQQDQSESTSEEEMVRFEEKLGPGQTMAAQLMTIKVFAIEFSIHYCFLNSEIQNNYGY